MRTLALALALSASPVLATALFAQDHAAPKQDTGGVSEEEFKKMHELSKEKPPAPKGETIELPGGSKAYLSLPKDPKNKTAPFPAVIVIHEWWGLNDHIRHWSDRLAAEGYAALAVDLYGGKVATDANQAMELMKGVDSAKATEIVKAAHGFLRKDPRVAATKVGSIGWCFGGHWSLECALNIPELDACVLYYGTLVTDPAELKKIKAPVLGIFGKKDKSITPDKVAAFDKALTEAKVEHAIESYDADHAFANPSGTRYDEESAKQAWEVARAFLAKKLR